MAKQPNGAIKIERGVAIPPAKARYPFAQMEVGDSFLAGDARACNAATQYSKSRGWDVRFRTRRMSDGWRIWRIAAFAAVLLLTAPALAGDFPNADGCYRNTWLEPFVTGWTCTTPARDDSEQHVTRDAGYNPPDREPPPHCEKPEKPDYQGGDRPDPQEGE